MIEENLKAVEENILRACRKAGRDRKEITLIAVSKTKPVSMIQEALKYQITQYGENKVQELVKKANEIPSGIDWHFIGHLQRNKVKYIVDKVRIIHSVDSIRLADEIDCEARKKNITVDILAQVNISGEESKFGLDKEMIYPFIQEAAKRKNIRIKGLMTVAPYVEDPQENRVHFQNLRKLLIDIKTKNIDNVTMDVLSMGMTNDYEVAIEEGATMIRVGTGIFGERYYADPDSNGKT